MSAKPEVSIILACYNAASYIEDSVRQIRDVMDATVFSYELIFVDDLSRDNTVELIKKLTAGRSDSSYYLHRHNHGRGKTVYDGIRRAKGDIVGFIDLDLDNPARYIFSMILGIKKSNADICTARRIYELKTHPYFIARMILSHGYARISSLWLQTGLKDTETGCKFFKKKAILPVLKETKDRGWFWDTEIMTRAYYKGLKIVEIPTLFMRNTKVSTVDFLPETLKYLWSLVSFWPEKNRLRKAWLNEEKKR